jgi:hypothetical protein
MQCTDQIHITSKVLHYRPPTRSARTAASRRHSYRVSIFVQGVCPIKRRPEVIARLRAVNYTIWNIFDFTFFFLWVLFFPPEFSTQQEDGDHWGTPQFERENFCFYRLLHAANGTHQRRLCGRGYLHFLVNKWWAPQCNVIFGFP